MDNLLERIRIEIQDESRDWQMNGDKLEVRFPHSNRKQVVSFHVREGHFLFRSIVLGYAEVTKTDRAWRDFARKVWVRNSHTAVVTFAFDDRDQLIGQIEQPIRTLDREELIFYIETLARECDEFEYTLTGEDRE